jgi:bifunctional DNA-binding transcriptional regulator/antitoxin component of YhaV-PrlF toxin-antitoxin module
MRVTVNVDEEMMKEVKEKLGDMQHKAPNAISNALNRAVTNVASNISKEVRSKYAIKAGDIKETITRNKSSRPTLSASVVSKGKLIPLDRFKVSPKTVQPKRKKPIKVAVKKEGLKEVLGAFVADINGIKVFERTSKSRLPIRRLFGPSVPQMLNNEEIRKKIEDEGQETFHKRLDHEINRILEKAGGN